jgi:mRNA interferase MazF
VVLVQNDAFTPRLPTVQIVPFTSQTQALRYPATVLIQPDGTNGLTVPSVALVFQARVLDKRRLRHRLGALSASDLALVQALLAQLFS